MAEPARTRLGRIRCLVQTVKAMQDGEQLPSVLCFVPAKIELECRAEEAVELRENPKLDASVVGRLEKETTHTVTVRGQPLFTDDGGWVQLIKPHENSWACIQQGKKGKPVVKAKIKVLRKDDNAILTWMDAVEKLCTLNVSRVEFPAEVDQETLSRLQDPPPGWSLEADEDLGRFLQEHDNNRTDPTAQGNEYIAKVEASSGQSEARYLLDPDPDSCWESDGDQGTHWLRFHMKPDVVIQSFYLLVDADDGSYLPKRLTVKAGGSSDNLTILSTLTFTSSDYDKQELCLFSSPATMHHPVVQVNFKSCYQGGIDVRLHGIKLVCGTMDSIFPYTDTLQESIFSPEAVVRWQKLEPYDSQQLFYRALALKRVAALIDKDFRYILPQWSLSIGSFGGVTSLRQLWPLCRERNALIEQMLHKSVSSHPSDRPILYINRLVVKTQQDDPSINPDKRMTIFGQVYREVREHTKPAHYDFRWAGSYTQWWECKFLQEGIIDQGGGFRDSLADVSEELCPSAQDIPVPVPLFIRSPNQSQDSSNVYRDAFTPNPSCSLFQQYYFVGQLMGATFRSQETLVLSLPQFLWKQLVGEPVTWSRDFVSVDSAEVKLIDSIESISREQFNVMFADVLNFTTVLSNGDTTELMPGGENVYVTYDNRLEYCKLVKTRRMEEGQRQIEALREGLTHVVPAQVLSLLTHQELEVKVCGSPDISIEAMKKSAKYEGDLSASSPRVKSMWQALETFSNEERSRFLRFITGRRRLPAPFYIESSDTGPDSLPSSATCSNALYLPPYPTVERAVQKLRYAAYNCVAIDVDMSPWE